MNAKIYNYARTSEEIKEDYNRNVKLIHRPLSNIIADQITKTTGQSITAGITVDSGSFKTIETGRCKKISCVTNGNITIPANFKQGTIIMKGIKKNTESTTYAIGLYSENKTIRYYINLASDNSVRLYLYSGSPSVKLNSGANYIRYDKEYDLKWTIGSAGVHTLYIRSDEDTNFLQWTKVVATTGSNPVTEYSWKDFSFIFLMSQSTNEIGQIELYNGVIQ